MAAFPIRIPIAKRHQSSFHESKPKTYPDYEISNHKRSSDWQRMLLSTSISSELGSLGSPERSPLLTRLKRCLNCQHAIYTISPGVERDLCSKDCSTCYNWFRRGPDLTAGASNNTTISHDSAMRATCGQNTKTSESLHEDSASVDLTWRCTDDI